MCDVFRNVFDIGFPNMSFNDYIDGWAGMNSKNFNSNVEKFHRYNGVLLSLGQLLDLGTSNYMVMWVLIIMSKLADARYGRDFHPKLAFVLVIGLGATRILDFELRRTYGTDKNATRVRREYLNLILEATSARAWMEPIGEPGKRNIISESKHKRIIETIMKRVPDGKIVIEEITRLVGVLAGRPDRRYYNTMLTKYNGKHTALAYLKLLVPSYINQIGTRRPGFTYGILESVASQNAQQVEAHKYVLRAVRNAKKMNEARATSRLTLDRWSPGNTGRRLPNNMVQKILYKAGMSRVDANTPGSNKERRKNLRRNAGYVREIITSKTREKKRRLS